jgi:hypothetical protein
MPFLPMSMLLTTLALASRMDLVELFTGTITMTMGYYSRVLMLSLLVNSRMEIYELYRFDTSVRRPTSRGNPRRQTDAGERSSQ